jgi:hypothetical protein
MTLAEPIAVTLEVTGALDKLGIRYAVGGSLASSVHGIPRSTQDLDLVVELPGFLVDALVSELEAGFYIDRDMIHDAIQRHGCFNILHLRTMFKVDLFVSDGSALLVEEMGRRQTYELGDPPRPVHVCTAEDIVIQKLDWFRQGGCVSERQWRDAVGVLSVRGAELDLAYVRRWAGVLGIADLCERAIQEAATGEG